jgi:hypothetical protein
MDNCGNGVRLWSGAVGVFFGAGLAGVDEAGGQAKETRRRRGGLVVTGDIRSKKQCMSFPQPVVERNANSALS